MSFDMAKSYHPLVLEMRDEAIEINESLEVYNSRVVLTEIPDTFMKVYLTGFTEIEEVIPKAGEYIVDYKTGIVTFGGVVKDNTIVSANYYGKGIIQYPAQRIYSHNPNPEVAGSLQKILDRGEEAIIELNEGGDLAKRTTQSNQNTLLGNNDWTRLIYKKQGRGQVFYNSTVRGIEIYDELWTFIRLRVPVEPDSKYYVRAKIRKTVGDGGFYLGAVSLDNDYNELKTDKAEAYNYFVASNKKIQAGSSEIIEGTISGYNTTSGNDPKKFDPEANYFDLVVIANHQTTHDISKTVIEWIEVYRSPKTMHIQHEASIGGTLVVNGQLTANSNLDMKNNNINRVKQINGEFGLIARSTDEWLRINDDGSHNSGTFFGTTLVRTDGEFQIGSSGSVFSVKSAKFNYKGLLTVDENEAVIATPVVQMTGDVRVNKTLTVDGVSSLKGNVLVSNSYISLTGGYITAVRSSSTDSTLMIRQDGASRIAEFGSTSDKLKFTIENNGSIKTKANAEINGNATIGGTLSATGNATLSGSLDLSSTLIARSNSFIHGNEHITGNLWVAKNTTWGTSPSRTISIGDADSGIDWVSDGVLRLVANSTDVAEWASSYFTINRKVNARASLDVTGDLLVTRDFTVNRDVAIKGNTATEKLFAKDTIFDNGTNTNVTIKSKDSGESTLSLTGDMQGTGKVFVGRSLSYGGGIEYNGDDTPVSSGAGSDYLALYRTVNGQLEWTARNLNSNNDWEFRGKATVNGGIDSKSDLSVTGAINTTGDVLVGGKSTIATTLIVGAKTTLNGGVEVKGGESLFREAVKVFKGLEMNKTDITNLKTLKFNDLGVSHEIFVGNESGVSTTTLNVLHFKGGKSKFWHPVQVTETMTVDRELRVASDIFERGSKISDLYVNVSGDTMTGNLVIGQTTFGEFTGGEIATALGGSNYGGLIVAKDTGHMAIKINDNDGSDSFAILNKSNTVMFRVHGASGLTKVRYNLEVGGNITEGGQSLDSKYLNSNGDKINGNLVVADGYAIVPATAEGSTLGTPEKPFKDVYIGANSLYVDGKKVVSSQADTIDISTDKDQHMSINTSGLGTTRLASGKEVILYSTQQVNLQAGSSLSAIANGVVSFVSEGSGVEIRSNSSSGHVTLKSTNLINIDSSEIKFFSRPHVNGQTVQLTTDSIAPSRITQDSTNRFVTDADKTNWNGKLNRSGGTMTGFITLHANPTSDLHAVTKKYVDAIKQSLDIKESVRVATTGNITLSGGQTIDGVSLNVGNRVLVKDQTDAKQNGIYVVASGAWVRAIDMDEDSDVTSGAFVFVEEGVKSANMGFVLTTNGQINVDVTPMSFTQFSGAGQVIAGTGIYKDGNELGLTNIVTAGSYRAVTVNAQGRVTGGSNPTTLSGYGIIDAVRKSGDTISGKLFVNSNSHEDGLYITRNARQDNEYIKTSVSDGNAVFEYKNDEASSSMVWKVENTDTEINNGVNANINELVFHASKTESHLSLNGRRVFHQGNMGSGSGLDADLLDGLHATAFLRANAKAVDSDKLDGLDSTDFLRVNAKAVDSDKLDNLDSSQFMRSDTSTGTTGNLNIGGVLKASKNAYQVTFSTSDTVTTKRITHNFNTNNYMVTVGSNTVKRHVGWTSKGLNSVDIEIDDLNLTENVIVDVVIVPI